ncbi:MAG: hypothetical protein WC277_08200 [Bacilli bacterium]
MKHSLETRINALEQAADPDVSTPLILFGNDEEPVTRKPRRVIRLDEEDRHL